MAVLVVIYVGLYIYLIAKDPDALRSESYTLTKLAIEHHLSGDDLEGLTETTDIAEAKAPKTGVLPAPGPKPRRAKAAKQDRPAKDPGP